MWNQIDDDDALLAKALEESLRHYNEVELPRTQASKLDNEELSKNGRLETDLFAQPSTSKQSNYIPQKQDTPKHNTANEQTSSISNASPEKHVLYEGEEAEGFDLSAGKTWLYPTNYPIREYQRNIVAAALFHNTLVSLPTGLGKTFIAAVVMYNFYKWYPKGKIIFMAPTKPLVAQQVEHCYNTMGIPRKDTAEMTGALASKDRAALWRGKRVFFLTPQVVQNDLSSGICPAAAVKCVVIDEAHRATGEYAYCQVVKLLQSFGGKFRVLALSATPGSDITAVQKVVSSLMISHIEIRNEDSPDLTPYTHERQIEIMSVSVGPIILQIREKYLRIMGEYSRKLQLSKVLFGNIASLSSFQILKSWNEFKSNPPPGMTIDTVRVLSAEFSLLHCLAHGLDLLQNYGLRLLLTNITDVMDDPTNSNGARLRRNDELVALIEEIRVILDPPPDNTLVPSQPDFIYGHPKLDALKDVVETHFRDFEARGVQTRVIVFCEYREAVIEIRQLLTALEPLVKPVGFMGQSSGKHGKGITQKKQLLVMDQFRKGVYNTLVSTSVGEEGLDIGEVDLIICYDAKNSPIRQVQRMGRTGRKRKGRIIVLATEGKEEMKFRSALAKKKNINAMLVEPDSLKGYLLDESPSMLPEGFKTECVEKNVVITPSTAPLQQQDLRRMFSRKSANNANNVSNPVAENPFVADEELNQMLPDALDDIGKAEDYYKNLDLSRYLEWQRYLQYTYEVDHSTSSEMMRDLLTDMVGEQDNNFYGLQTQISATQIWPGFKKRGSKRSGISAGGKRKKPRVNSEKKLGRPASPSSESSEECPVPSSFQAKPGRVNPLSVLPVKNNVTEEPSDPIPMDTSFQMDQPLSPIEMNDDSDDCDLDPEIKDALKKLGIAFRHEDDSFLDEECPICSHLEPCEEIAKMLNAEKRAPAVSWTRMEEMLNRVKSIVPRLTKDSFALPSPPGSPNFVSMIPREEFQRGEDSFNSGIFCGGVGDVSVSPLKESEIVKHHSDESNASKMDLGEDSFTSNGPSLLKSKIVTHNVSHSNSPKMDHFGEETLLDLHLDDIFAKIENQMNINGTDDKMIPSDHAVTSPILGSQPFRKPRSSQATPTPKANPKKSLFPIFELQNHKPSAIIKSNPVVSPEKFSQRDVTLDFDAFLELSTSQFPEEYLESSQKRNTCSTPRKKETSMDQNGLSPVLSKSQFKSKLKERKQKESPEEKSKLTQSSPNRLSLVFSSAIPQNDENETTRKETEAFFEDSEEDMFAGLECQSEENFDISDVKKLDLDCGFMDKAEDNLGLNNSLRKEVNSPVEKLDLPVEKVDLPGKLADLVWMDKSNASIVANMAPPQNRKQSKLSLKRNSSKSTAVLGKTKKPNQREKSPNSSPTFLPDCFQLKKPRQTVTSKSVSKPKNPIICVSSDEDEFSRKVPDLPLSPIAKLERPVTPNAALDELVKNLIPLSPESTSISPPKVPEVGNKKRLLSSSPSPEMPRKKQNAQVQSSPESPLFVKPKKGFKRPLDDTVVESSGATGARGWLQAKEDSIRKSGNKSSAEKTGRRVGLSGSSDEEFVVRPTRKKERQKTPKEKKKAKKKKSLKNAFLESQAVESSDECRNSSDGESTSLDGLDSSFIDDSPNETVVDNDIDMQARYLQTVRSPAVKHNAFKIPHPSALPFRGNIYSQAVNPNDYSSYMNDSFCVDEDLEEQGDPEMSTLDIAEALLKAEKKERRRKEKEKKPREAKKRSRIVRPRDSSESDDDIQVIEIKPNQNKKIEPKSSNQLQIVADTKIASEWFDDDFDVPELNGLVEISSNQFSTSKPGPSSIQKSTSKSESIQVQRSNTNDINRLLDDSFDFSKVSSVEFDVPNDFAKSDPGLATSTFTSSPLVIFVSSRQVASATEILRLLRLNHKVSISPRSSTCADYVISRRLGVCRVAISDLKSNEKIAPTVKRLKESFARSVLIVENDKENRLLMATKNFQNKGRGPPPPPKAAQSEWTSNALITITHLRQASVEILFSDEKALTARLLADLCKGERDAGFQIPPVPQEFSNEMEKKLKFLTTIPGINIALAVHLIYKFKTIKSFISNCSKVKDIQRNVGVNHQAAQKIHSILFQVHTSK